MKSTLQNYPTINNRQSGAALVVALILLIALSLMAVSSMNTASLDLVMAGNEQYRSRAFFAAESNVERALLGDAANNNADFIQDATAAGNGNDTYAYTLTRPNKGATDDPPPGNTVGKFRAIYFRIISSGTSERGSTAQVIQEFYEIAPSENEDQTANKDACAKSNLLSADSTGCS